MFFRINKNIISIAVVAISLGALGLSSYFYGLEAQRQVVISIIPMLFSGLLLGRIGVWVTLVCYFPILLLGAWVEMHADVAGMEYPQDILFDLTQPLLGSLIIALILDRLIMKVEVGKRLNRDLIIICERLENEIREHEASQTQLIHSQRIDALGKLASNVSHDFNNILSIVIGYVRRTRNSIDKSDEAIFFLNRIEVAVRRGQSLTSRLLTLVRDDGYSVEKFDVNVAIGDLVPMLLPLFSPGVFLQIDLAKMVLPVLMRRNEFEAVLLNMAKNSNDALGAQGKFCISTAVIEGAVLIRVEDNGQGMSSPVSAKIFEPFYTTKSREQGTGIGLAVAYRVITEAGGRIEVESEQGVGTVFTIRLPLAQQRGVNPVQVARSKTS